MTIFIALIITLISVVWLQAALINAIVPQNLGVNNGEFSKPKFIYSEISTQTSRRESFVEPLPFIGTFEETKERFHASVNKVETYTMINGYKEYEHLLFTSSFLHLNDDVEVFYDHVLKKIHYRGIARVALCGQKRNLLRYQAIKKIYLDNC